jgi:hypothetical protein
MKSVLAASFLLLALCGPAMAAGCEADIKKIDAAIKSEEISPDVKAQVKDMRAQAESLCKAGNEEEAADVIAEAKSLLAIE